MKRKKSKKKQNGKVRQTRVGTNAYWAAAALSPLGESLTVQGPQPQRPPLLLATQGCSRSLTQGGVWSCRAVITPHHTVSLFSYDDNPVKDLRNEKHPRGDRHTQSRLRSDRCCGVRAQFTGSSQNLEDFMYVGWFLPGKNTLENHSKKIWDRKTFQFQEFKCWAQELSHFNVKFILSVCGLDASRFHITLAHVCAMSQIVLVGAPLKKHGGKQHSTAAF